MMNRFHDQTRQLVTGLKLAGKNADLVQTAIALAGRTRMRLKFTHVVEDRGSDQHVYPSGYMSDEGATHLQDDRIKDATSELSTLLRPYLSQSEFEINVLSGEPPDAICSDALASRASLILCAYNTQEQSTGPEGHATALSLMSNCSLPVVVLPEGKTTFTNALSRTTILVADDLTETSSDALPTTMEFASALQNTDVIHLHIHPETQEELKKIAYDVKDRMLQKEPRSEVAFDPESFVERTDDAIRSRLHARSRRSDLNWSERGVSYSQRVAFGPVFSELVNAVALTAPDLIVFGRHQFLHRRPISIGKVPFYSMLNFNLPIMVVANVECLANA